MEVEVGVVEREYEVDLLGHCAFCRRLLLEADRASGDEDDIEDGMGVVNVRPVPKAVIVYHLLESFSHVWSYLFEGGLGESLSLGVKYKFSSGKQFEVIQEIPPMCGYCGERVQELDKLHRELMRKVEDIRRIVQESVSMETVSSWKGEGLQAKLEKSDLKPRVKESTFQFLGHLLKSSLNQNTVDAPTAAKINTEKDPLLSDSESDFTVKEEVISPPPSPLPKYENVTERDAEEEEMSDSTEFQDDIDDGDGVTSEGESSGASSDEESTKKGASSEEEAISSDSDYRHRPMPVNSRNLPGPRKSKETRRSNNTSSLEKVPLHSPAKKFRCHPCKKSFNLEKYLILHQIKAHGLDPVPHLKCKFCDRLCANWHTLEDHEKTHSDIRDFKCDKEGCDKTFKTRIGLSKHKHIHKLVKNVCETCGKSFYSVDTLKHHMKSVHLGVKHICNICGASLSTAYGLRGHIRSLHTGERPFSCSNCTSAFHTKTELNCHLKRCINNRNIGNRPGRGSSSVSMNMRSYDRRKVDAEGYKCNFKDCPERFPKMHDLLKHKKTHGELQKFICETCGKGLASAVGLRAHQEATHLGVKKFICEVCGQGYSGKGYLRDHMLIHTLERPHSCPLCGQRFRQTSTLHAHLRRHERKGDKFRPQGPMKHFRGRAC